ncbi:MAG: SpoIIE family protein phosphatase [Bacteroidales bacterium]|nr:SpoIIE family protein phosphatase [Bacteroidales bacterium]
MPVSRAYVLAFAMLSFLPYRLSAQNYLQPEIISIKEGLSSHFVHDVMIDQRGYLWAATKNGLNRYDGYGFKHLLTEQLPAPLQESQEIKRMVTDSHGNIWFVSTTGVGMYDSNTGEISFYDRESIDENLDVSAVLIDIYVDAENAVWVLTDAGVTQMKPGQFSESYAWTQEQQDHSITCITADQGGSIWIGSSRGPLILNKQSGNFIELISETNQATLSHPHVNCLFVEQEGPIWIGTAKGLNRFDPVNFNIRTFYPESTGQFTPGNEILDIAHYEDGSILVVTGTGIMIFDLQDEQFSDVYAASEIKVFSAVSDAFGNIWSATSRGILKLRNSDLLVRNYNTMSTGLKLTENHVTALYTVKGDQLWVGYENGAYDIINIHTSDVIRKQTTTRDEIRGFYRFSANSIMVVTEHGLILSDENGSELTNLSTRYAFIRNEFFRDEQINCMLQDPAGRIWLGTSDGLQLLQTDEAVHQRRTVLKSAGDSLVLHQVYDIAIDNRNNLWLGTDNGLILFDPEQESFYKYTPYDKVLLNTENKKVYKIISEAPDHFWIGTSRGIFRFDINNREFTALNDPDLMNSAVRTVTFDQYGNIWIGTDMGLYYYKTDRNALLFFNPDEGLVNYAYNASTADGAGNVYVGGDHGLSRVNIISVEPSFRYHDVVITGMYWIEKDIREEISFEVPDTLILPLRKNSLQINFAVLDLSNPESNRFSYAFVKAGSSIESYRNTSQPYVILNPLSHGKYVFSVKGSNSHMVWNPADDMVVIIVGAPFWRSTIALILYGILVTGLLTVLFRQWSGWISKKNRQRKEKEMIAKQIMEQKEELSVKNKSITDSINYAKRIQTAMLPPYKMLKTIFPSSFILYMPKDIVSGDFYWINTMYDKTFLAAVDCTGHGVPGAFMSIIGFELFRKITSIEGLTRPSDILNRLNEDFHEIFKDVDNVVLRDGMDVAFCSIDKNNKILEFAGAFNPLYLIRDDKITEIKGDRFAIGLDETNFMDQTFKNHIIPLQEEDIIYIFSDGFADQFGGPDGKKYKYRRFKHLLLNLHRLEMEKQREILENNVLEWRGEQEQVDDILIIGIKMDF